MDPELVEWRINTVQFIHPERSEGWIVWPPSKAPLVISGKGENLQDALTEALEVNLPEFASGMLSKRWRMYTSLPETPEWMEAILSAKLNESSIPELPGRPSGHSLVVELGLYPVAMTRGK